ncbi:DDE-type integrase/transposase/recombinase [bacterium]|nr:DDE-type integrase/transposase/recombinase [bacterium]
MQHGQVQDISTFSEEIWREAKRRAEIIRPLAVRKQCPQPLVEAAAQQLDLSVRQVYFLVKRCRACDGALDALVPFLSSGGRGGTRISKDRENFVRGLIDDVYLAPQRLSAAAFIREVRRRAELAGLKPPSYSTISRRLANLLPEECQRRGERGSQLTAVSGKTPIPRFPLDTLQIDHTKVDIILVDPIERRPIGRPWLTVAIDLCSRCIAGIHLSLEAPSATSVGLCLVHVARDKASWLAECGIKAEWPIEGKPGRVSVDNGAEFHSCAFERGCDQHGIQIDWRPPGQPHFGGIVERVIGSLMKLVHELPGTTFSNPTERHDYNSEAAACLTMEELTHWLTIAITGIYHQRPHKGLAGDTPLNRYRAGMAALTLSGALPPMVKNPRAFLIDFLPVVRRTLRRDGIVLDHVTYYSLALNPWIAKREKMERLLIRRDPRDISRIYVFDPVTAGYLEIPYRDLSRPALSLWEHRLALRHLRARHNPIDETSIFKAVAEMRAIEKSAVSSTKSARRNRTRRLSSAPHQPIATPTSPGAPLDARLPANEEVLRPFDEIEGW